MSVRAFGRYTHAIVRRVPDSFVNAIGSQDKIDLRQARLEHANYVSSLRDLGLNVIELPADERHPDCPFVEDTAVVINEQAFICRPGHPLRVDETHLIKRVLKNDLKLSVVEIEENDEATIDGGDVLFTGEELFVGLSQRTNYQGANALAKAFPEYPTIPVVLPASVMHLKCVVSMCGPKIIAVGSSSGAEKVFERIESEANSNYKFIKLPDDDASNCVYANGCVIYRNEFPRSKKVFEERIDFAKKAISVPNMSKPQALLTCMSLLIKKDN